MRWLTGVLQKARGLLGTKVDAEPVVLVGCGSIHTVGMRYPLDVAFVSCEGLVLKTVRRVWPGTFVSCANALLVIERPAADGPWVSEGDVVALCAEFNEGLGGEKLWKEL